MGEVLSRNAHIAKPEWSGFNPGTNIQAFDREKCSLQTAHTLTSAQMPSKATTSRTTMAKSRLPVILDIKELPTPCYSGHSHSGAHISA